MNYYEHHLGDYAAATAHLSWDEDMAYTRLLRAYYHHERGIPQGQQYRLARATTPAQRKAVDTVLAEFFTLTGDAFTQSRAEREIVRYQDKQRKAKASANARWSNSERNANAPPDAMRTHMRTHSEGNAPNHQTPVLIHSVPSEPAIASPPTDREMVFASGVTLLTAAGVSDKNARSFLAAQCKAHGEPAVRDALQRCASEAPIQPVPWLTAVLKSSPAKPRKSDALMAGNIAVVQRFLAGETHD